MRHFRKIANPKLPIPLVLVVIACVVGGATFLEKKELDKIEHPAPKNVSCIKCHSDKATLKAMADKADDPLYLVHSGQLTLPELQKLMGNDKCPDKNPHAK